VVYNDDLLLHSKPFEEHLTHLDFAIGNLTKVGFIVNAVKCRFCRDKEKLLRHCIDKTGVSADPDQVETILNYTAPRNSKQLLPFFGTCKFHSLFVVDYANYVAPLLPLLKKGTK
jgi:hypothetical protein